MNIESANSSRFPLTRWKTFERPSLSVISTAGRNLNALESLRFLVVDTPRNDKIQRSRGVDAERTGCVKMGVVKIG